MFPGVYQIWELMNSKVSRHATEEALFCRKRQVLELLKKPELKLSPTLLHSPWLDLSLPFQSASFGAAFSQEFSEILKLLPQSGTAPLAVAEIS